MSIAKSLLAVVCVCVALSATVEARTLPFRVCRGPPENVEFNVSAFFPDPEKPGSFFLAGSNLVNFTKLFKNAYSGHGVNIPLDPSIPAGGPIDLLAILDPRTCTLTGSVYVFDLAINDLFRMKVNRNFMAGDYMSFSNNTLRFEAFGRLRAEIAK